MFNNPFRQQRGGGAFRSSGSGRSGSNWKNKKNTSDEQSAKEKEWGKVKFNPIAKTAKADHSTPWSKFKGEIIQTERDKRSENAVDLDSVEAKLFLKKREENYKKTLIKEKRMEPTKWEDFSDDAGKKEKNQNEQKKKGKARSKEFKNKRKTNESEKSNLSPSLLQNFDSKTLTSEQNNHLRKVLTKTTCMARGNTLVNAVKDMKRRADKWKQK